MEVQICCSIAILKETATCNMMLASGEGAGNNTAVMQCAWLDAVVDGVGRGYPAIMLEDGQH
jgi:hypothetical protein